MESGEWTSSCPSHFTAGERTLRTQLTRKLDGFQIMSGYFKEEIIFFFMLGPEPRIVQPVA
jgi:hypothetical protein